MTSSFGSKMAHVLRPFFKRNLGLFCQTGVHIRKRQFTASCIMSYPHADRPHDIGPFTNDILINKPEENEPIATFRIMDNEGNEETDSSNEVSTDVALEMYRKIVLLSCFDFAMTEAQKSGFISFYLASHGEEACQVASAAALQDDDLIFPQYREAGVVLWRGISLETLIDSCRGNSMDSNKGRQMPIHYGSRQHNYVTVASTVGPQTIHAVGAAYAYKRRLKDACVVTYFGDGGMSTGDVHAGLNFAATLETPLIFFCRNNQLAISTPIIEEMWCDGAAARARGYGLANIRVDGNDALAVYRATQMARQVALRDSRPVLVEAMTYRVGPHSTNVDCDDYRDTTTPSQWIQSNNPITRLRNYLEKKSMWNENLEEELRRGIQSELEAALRNCASKMLPNMEYMFTDVYHEMPQRLRRQMAECRHHVTIHSDSYPLKDHEGM